MQALFAGKELVELGEELKNPEKESESPCCNLMK